MSSRKRMASPKTLALRVLELKQDRLYKDTSIRKLCKLVTANTNANPSSVRKAYGRIKNRDWSQHDLERHGNRAGSYEQEQALVAAATGFAIVNGGLSKEDFLVIASQIFKRSVTKHYYYDFRNRYSDIFTLSQRKTTCERRASKKVATDVKHYTTKLEQIISEKAFKSKDIFNVDETLITVNEDKLNYKRLALRKRVIGERKKKKESTIGTMCPFVSADGTCWYIYYCFKGVDGKEVKLPTVSNAGPNLRGSGVRLYHGIGFSETGYMGKRNWKAAIEGFRKAIDAEMKGKEVLLLCDNLGSHRELDTLTWCLEHLIYTLFLPPNTSHFTQPLDDLMFSVYKSMLRLECSRRRWRNLIAGVDTKHIIQQVQQLCEQKAFAKKTIQASFENCGVWPLDTSKIHLRALENNCSSAAVKTSTNLLPACTATATNAVVELIQSFSSDPTTITVRHQVDYEKTTTVEELIEAEQKKATLKEKTQKEAEDTKILKRQLQEQKKKEKLDQARKKKEEQRSRKRKLEQKKKDALNLKRQKLWNKSCRYLGCEKLWISSSKWLWCEYCLDSDWFGVCSLHCKTSEGMKLMTKHEASCKKKYERLNRLRMRKTVG